MSDEPYKNRELDVRFHNLSEKMDENHRDVLDVLGEIRTQTTKTNGKVAKHDVYLRAAIIAAPLLSIIGGILFYAYTQDRKALEEKIEAAKEIVELRKTTR